MELQQKLIEQLHTKFTRAQLVKEFVNLLGISQSAAYNKVNCTSELTLSEYGKISTEYRMHTFEMGSIITVDFPFIVPDNHDFKSLTQIMIEEFRIFINDYNKPSVRYCTNIIPMQLLTDYPKLFQFTVFVWMENINALQDLNHYKYDKISFDKTYEEEYEISKKLTKLYRYCDFHTYLSPNIFETYFRLIEYHLELDTISLEQVMELKDEMMVFLEEFEHLCQNKETPNNFYIHELTINSVLFQVSGKHTYLFQNSPIYFRIDNKTYNEYTKTWLDQIESRSIPISNINEKVRRGLFKNMKNSSEKFFKKMELLHEI